MFWNRVGKPQNPIESLIHLSAKIFGNGAFVSGLCGGEAKGPCNAACCGDVRGGPL